MATFGETNVVTSLYYNLDVDEVLMSAFTLSTGGGNADVSKLTAYYNRNSISVKGYIYDDNATAPNNLVAVTNIDSSSTGYGWHDLTFASNPELINGNVYWLGVVASGSSMKMAENSGGGTSRVNTTGISGFYASPPDPFSGSLTNDDGYDASIYATYEIAGGNIAIPVPLGPVW